ncbi:MAG: zinc-ribbon domain-containing protein [Firmicutes bacterium]|nr:zinc-ribbon domain-containing protein [Bacillota bacterium]
MKKCPKCGAIYSDENAFCAECGIPLGANTVINETAQAQGENAAVNAENNEETVFCKNCGKPIQSGSTFCNECGTPISQTQGQQNVNASYTAGMSYTNVGVKSKNTKLIGIAALAAIAVVIIIALIAMSSGGSSSSIITAWNVDGDIYFLCNADVLEYTAESSASSVASSLDGSVKLYYSSSTDELIAVSSKSANVITDEYAGVLCSSDGSKVVYYTNDGEIYLYDVSSDKNTSIGEFESLAALAISPDGSVVVYTDSDSDEVTSYMYKSGSTSELELSQTKIPFAVSDSGKYIYCYDTSSDSIYISDKNGNTEKIKSDVESYFLFNDDNTKMIFFTDDGTYRYSANGEAEKISSSEMIPANFLLGYNISGRIYSGYFYTYTMDVENFSGLFYLNDSNSLYYCDKNFESEKVASSIDDCNISDDGKVVMYTKNDKLYRVTKSSYDEPVEIGTDVDSFEMLSDGSAAYYIDEDDTLIYTTKSGKQTKIADDVYSVYITHDGYALFLVDYYNGAGTLYRSKNGSSREKVDDDVVRIIVGGGATLYATGDSSTYDVYAAKSGVNFTRVLKECESYCG